jgi:F-type H+-transporting ATPase subunit b
MITLFRQGFGFNTDIYETNVLNLTVVLVVVIKVVGDSLRDLLDQRRQTILMALREADQKARDAKKRLEKARRDLEETRLRATEIRTQVVQTIERKNIAIQGQLERDLIRLRETGRQAIAIEQRRMKKAIYEKLTNLALSSAENTLLKTFQRQEIPQKKFNEIRTQTMIHQIKRL